MNDLLLWQSYADEKPTDHSLIAVSFFYNGHPTTAIGIYSEEDRTVTCYCHRYIHSFGDDGITTEPYTIITELNNIQGYIFWRYTDSGEFSCIFPYEVFERVGVYYDPY